MAVKSRVYLFGPDTVDDMPPYLIVTACSATLYINIMEIDIAEY